MTGSLATLGLVLFSFGAGSDTAVPVGLDAYRQWHLWPMQRTGVRAHMRSTYDRTGGNRFISPRLHSS